jgi:hypothetical protein
MSCGLPLVTPKIPASSCFDVELAALQRAAGALGRLHPV